MNEHAHPLSVSERADELEEEKMHEMERIITKSTIAHLMDGEVKMDTSPEMKSPVLERPGQHFFAEVCDVSIDVWSVRCVREAAEISCRLEHGLVVIEIQRVDVDRNQQDVGHLSVRLDQLGRAFEAKNTARLVFSVLTRNLL